MAVARNLVLWALVMALAIAWAVNQSRASAPREPENVRAGLAVSGGCR